MTKYQNKHTVIENFSVQQVPAKTDSNNISSICLIFYKELDIPLNCHNSISTNPLDLSHMQ